MGGWRRWAWRWDEGPEVTPHLSYFEADFRTPALDPVREEAASCLNPGQPESLSSASAEDSGTYLAGWEGRKEAAKHSICGPFCTKSPTALPGLPAGRETRRGLDPGAAPSLDLKLGVQGDILQTPLRFPSPAPGGKA